MNTAINPDMDLIVKYLNGDMYLKDVIKETGLSEYKINLIIQEYKLPKLKPKTMTPAQLKRMQCSSAMANLEIQQVINEQLNREKQWRVTEEISNFPTITAEKFLSSKLVTRSRIYGTD